MEVAATFSSSSKVVVTNGSADPPCSKPGPDLVALVLREVGITGAGPPIGLRTGAHHLRHTEFIRLLASFYLDSQVDYEPRFVVYLCARSAVAVLRGALAYPYPGLQFSCPSQESCLGSVKHDCCPS
jgi:hypothetical protein